VATAQARAGLGATPAERAAMLERAAACWKTKPALLGLIMREAGKTAANAVGEVREAVDFLRYYAAQARSGLAIPPAWPGGVHLARGTSRWRSLPGKSPPRWWRAIRCWPSPPRKPR
jgi:RHH-type proline utilization regulon transcriptional repressor/proline dehydrogenase/delta 1-pyrroline-5-carboxylate dehydrogenase